MNQHVTPFAPAALRRSVPRYTSYPTAPHFGPFPDPGTYARWLAALPPDMPLSLYVHVPFCDDLCWFCACRTQGAKTYAPLPRYLDCLEAEIDQVSELLGPDHPVVHIHWGGGSPTILRPADMARVRAIVARAFPRSTEAEFAVEIDPRDMTPDRMDALAAAALNRASIGVQDFEPRVQLAIGRIQGHEMTRDVVDGLRARGVGSVNMDLLYGLPHQTCETLARTLDQVLALAPDRLALFGYAHVPWMARRQRMIDEAALPDAASRRAQAAMARRRLIAAGYEAVGIDHFALPGDGLAQAAREGTLRRNFQGYTVDRAACLIAFGASAIGALPQGYVQNETATASYQNAVEAGDLPVQRGCALSDDDRARRDAIEQILCGFALDLYALRQRHGERAADAGGIARHLLETAPPGALLPWRGGFRLGEGWHEHARLIAAEFDAYLDRGSVRHSLAV
jgi:oxygen-independent coproporphyrinogen-3 oxidase